MAKVETMAQDAEVMLTQLQQRAATLRDVANLVASHAELQQASERGGLICWNPVKLHGPDGFQRFEPGDPMPKLEPQHALLDPARRAVTTAARWAARNEYKALAGYLDAHDVARRLRGAKAAEASAASEIARLEHELALAKQTLRQAAAERRTVEAELLRFVERAPVAA
jgi:hypothetical protein